MDAALKFGESRLADIDAALKSSAPPHQDQFKSFLVDLESSLIDMGKICLDELRACNEEFESLERNVTQSEGHIQFVKDCKGGALRKAGNPCSWGALVPTADVDTYEYVPLLLPTKEPCQIACGILDSIGRSANEITTSNATLIRRTTALDARAWMWVKQSDYFVLKNSKEPSTFQRLYG
jgi:hypothetical protein